MNNYTIRIFENGREIEDERIDFTDYSQAFEYMQKRRSELEDELKDFAEDISLRIDLSQTVATTSLKAIYDED